MFGQVDSIDISSDDFVPNVFYASVCLSVCLSVSLAEYYYSISFRVAAILNLEKKYVMDENIMTFGIFTNPLVYYFLMH